MFFPDCCFWWVSSRCYGSLFLDFSFESVKYFVNDFFSLLMDNVLDPSAHYIALSVLCFLSLTSSRLFDCYIHNVNTVFSVLWTFWLGFGYLLIVLSLLKTVSWFWFLKMLRITWEIPFRYERLIKVFGSGFSLDCLFVS